MTLKLDVTAFNSLNMSPFKDILTEVTDWEGFQLRNIQFFNSTNLTKVPDYLPSSIRSMARMFYGCTSFNQDLSSMIFESTVNNSFYAEGATAWNPAYRPKFTG